MIDSDASSLIAAPHRGRTTLIHGLVLCVSVSVIAIGISFKVYPDQTIGCRFSEAHRLPPTCMFREYLNFNCPGCGLTRSIVHFFHFDFRASLSANRVGWLLAMAIVFQLPSRVIALRRMKLPAEQWSEIFPYRFSIVWLVLLAANWVFKLLVGH